MCCYALAFSEISVMLLYDKMCERIFMKCKDEFWFMTCIIRCMITEVQLLVIFMIK